MENITQKTIGMLLDELITTNIKCWFAQENIKDNNDIVVAQAARLAQNLNKRRCELIQAIDNILNPNSYTMTDKSY